MNNRPFTRHRKLVTALSAIACTGVTSWCGVAKASPCPGTSPCPLIVQLPETGDSTPVAAIDDSAEYEGPDPTNKRWLHGFRVGAVYVANHDVDKRGPGSSLQEEYDIRSPLMFAIGYEGMRRIVGHSWLNVILVGNVSVLGLEQSQVIPSGNALIGFEIDQSFQVGVGANFTPEEGKEVHMIGAVGWTPKVGGFFVPVHFTYIPDVDGNHRFGSTIGVNW